MAWIWSLYIECETLEYATRVAEHFGRFFIPSIELRIDIRNTPPYEVTIAPVGVFPSGGPTTKGDCLKTLELGTLLLENLKTVPFFRFACVGTEVGGFRAYEDFAKELDFPTLGIHGIVLNESIWTILGKPTAYEAFSKGFYWIPYRGEDPRE